jgi:CheY-like chemotaxis protein
MSESNRYELARRLAEQLETDAGVTNARVWLCSGEDPAYLPVISPSVTQVEQITEATAAELVARGSLGLGADLKPVLGYVEIPGWESMDPQRREVVTECIERTAQAMASAEAISSATSDAPRKILIADEDDALRKSVRAVLCSAGYEVVEATTGPEAIEKTRAELPDLVVMAWLLPVVNGKDATVQLKADPSTRHIPILMLTKRTRIEDKVEALSAGVQDFMTKPFDFRELLARIEQQVRWRKLLDQTGEPSAAVAVEPQPVEPAAYPQFASWNAMLEAQDYSGVLNGAMQYAQACEEAGKFEDAAQAYETASRAADGSRRPDLTNKLQRLAGSMYLRLAEESTDTAKIQLGYTMSARMFLTAGNLELAQEAAEHASDRSSRG